jgi:UDP-2-acetamido-3-amino-2,3-dideoxy-glucuronate N-acetyltransferase
MNLPSGSAAVSLFVASGSPLGSLTTPSAAAVFVHPSAEVHTTKIGAGTTIWQFCVVLAGARIGTDCNINAHCFIEDQVVVGDHVTVKCGVQLWNGVTLEDHVFVGPNATFTNDRYPRSKVHDVRLESTRVGRGASIGANATILCGVTIGRDAMIGAGSVVTKDVPEGELWWGNPARCRGPAPPKRVSSRSRPASG